MSEKENPMQRIIAKCWEDEAFKKRLMADPAGTLKSEGLKFPEGVTISVLENSPEIWTLVIPAKPTVLSEADLEFVSGGKIGPKPP